MIVVVIIMIAMTNKYDTNTRTLLLRRISRLLCAFLDNMDDGYHPPPPKNEKLKFGKYKMSKKTVFKNAERRLNPF